MMPPPNEIILTVVEEKRVLEFLFPYSWVLPNGNIRP
jgi:hypothetical protein